MNYEMRLPFRGIGVALLSMCFFLSVDTVLAQVDSVVISGRIRNLTGALYRQSPVITFTRNNILQPQTELTRQAPLQADGSFRVALPLIYSQEEVYLDYGGKVFTTFLAAPGELQLSFDADSMFKAKRLFYFAGVNAEANNQYVDYLVEEGKVMKENKRYGQDFFNSFWNLEPGETRRALDRRAELRQSALLPLSKRGALSPILQSWVQSIVQDERLSTLYEYALANNTDVDAETKDKLSRLTNGIMTFQRVQWATRAGDYADRLLERRAFQFPTKSKSLPVETMAELLKKYARPLSAQEGTRLDDMIREGTATTEGLNFLNDLYARNRRALDLVTMIEKQDRAFRTEFDGATADLLDARMLVQRFYQSMPAEQEILYQYLSTKITEPKAARSLDELYQLEIKDSAAIALVQKRTDLGATPTEVLDGIWLTESRDNGRSWFKNIENFYQGKTLYVIKWNLNDDGSRNEVLYAPTLRAQLPADVEFLYIHVPNVELVDRPALWKKFIVRNKLRGVHMFLDESQATQLILKLNPLAFPSFAIIGPNGKFVTRAAPAPSNGQAAAEALLRARSER